MKSDNTWKKKKGINPAVYDAIVAEIKAAMALAAPEAAPDALKNDPATVLEPGEVVVTPMPDPPAATPEPPAAELPKTFTELVSFVTDNNKTMEQARAACDTLGISEFTKLMEADNANMIPYVAKAILEVK